MNSPEKTFQLGDRVRVRTDSRNCPGEYGIVMGWTVDFRSGSGERVVHCTVALDQDKGGTDFKDKDLLKEFKIGDHVRVAAKANSDGVIVDAVIVSLIHCDENTSLWHVVKQSNLNAQASIFYEDLTFVPPDQEPDVMEKLYRCGLLGSPISGSRKMELPEQSSTLKSPEKDERKIMPKKFDFNQLNNPHGVHSGDMGSNIFDTMVSSCSEPLFSNDIKEEIANRVVAKLKDAKKTERTLHEKLDEFAKAYGMSAEAFKEYREDAFRDARDFAGEPSGPGDEARKAAKKIRAAGLKELFDKGRVFPPQRIIMSEAQFQSLAMDPTLSTVPPKETWSATIVLASGREVSIPDPDPEKWELIETKKNLPIVPVQIVLDALCSSAGVEGSDRLHLKSYSHAVVHEQGRCWIKDMKRIVEQIEPKGPFENRFSYLVELRHFKERVIENSYPNPLPALSVLW